jgi:hypothetical protein
MAVGEKVYGKVLLPNAITQTNRIELKYNENVFGIEFAALNYFDADKVKFEYMMQGFDKSWITADNITRKAVYTNLDAGDYTFKVRASNPGFWKSKEISAACYHITTLVENNHRLYIVRPGFCWRVILPAP